ncbi:uncharacterized protein LOC113871570 [Abrus precatorius]|uniref:Uncharacterized protein LOC113871570 n=1 Tax=Abrus precatorius TaxID=3816 RepID=A0A8B8M709_ABRPR|nr:uncharacterized protein LOC113871570 [Abrus precatorius]
MKGLPCLVNTHYKLNSCLPFSKANLSCYVNVGKVRNLGFKVDKSFWSSHASCLVHQRKDNNGFVVESGRWSSVEELEREVEAEMKTQKDERFRHKCGEEKGVVEMLVCLEMEAIMGEDVGKHPMDYNRRAHIFDTSSRVFQALKELNSHA